MQRREVLRVLFERIDLAHTTKANGPRADLRRSATFDRNPTRDLIVTLASGWGLRCPCDADRLAVRLE